MLTHAAVDEADVREYECELDRENGKAVYEIEFRCDDTEYEYRVDAVTGGVLFSEKDTKPTTSLVTRTTTTFKRTETTRTTATTVRHTTQTTTTAVATTCTTTGTQPANTRLSKEQVKAIVLTHAGADAQAVRGYECELNRRNGNEIYEIEFRFDGTEYEYRVDAVTGNILSVEKETDRD